MKYAIFFLACLYSVSSIAMHMPEERTMQQPEEDPAVLMLEQMLDRCALERSLVAPPNTPSPMCAQDGCGVDLQETPSMFNCVVADCPRHYANFQLLSAHVRSAHGLFLCRCGALFYEYLCYYEHQAVCEKQ